MHRFVWPDNRFITILSSGNQETTEVVLNKVNTDLDQAIEKNLLNVNSFNEVTDYIANISAQAQKQLKKKSENTQKYAANFIIAGQIQGQPMETQLVYAQGNYIHESKKSPFLQIGEIKYGKPILDRMVKRNISLETAARCALVSMDSMMRSKADNITPIELLFYRKDSTDISAYLSFDNHNPLLSNISKSWACEITKALDHLPNFHWEN